MRARRTPLVHYLVALVLGLMGGAGISELGMSTRTDLMGVPWLVSVLLFLLGVAILIMAFQVHRYAKGDRKQMDLRFAVNVLIMSKAMGIACAALLGWYGSQALISMGHAAAPYYTRVMQECLVASLVCLLDVVAGAVGEWLCQLPPDDGPENPDRRKSSRRPMADAADTTERAEVKADSSEKRN
ncbi:DUF3180 domain-containing protein [Bifidobacterium asteroides]|uniref:DUF3180 domain-containing protein n=1 Tax=Bifidobacterium asteroides TaxID=1684 RepID=UPI0018DB32A7|nr:DUF3180 domain-containing protein [Bifidobacterium asteroides]MBH9983521.1 DUF3180 domain-containing protein [Bifidobacterium asteroides]